MVLRRDIKLGVFVDLVISPKLGYKFDYCYPMADGLFGITDLGLITIFIAFGKHLEGLAR